VNRKRRKTLAAIFTDPVPGMIDESDVEGLLIVAGAKIIVGTRARFV
jgi:hypothetical protein